MGGGSFQPQQQMQQIPVQRHIVQETKPEVKVEPKANSARLLVDIIIDTGGVWWLLTFAFVGALYVVPRLIKKWLGEK